MVAARIEPVVDVRATLAVFRSGAGDPTTRLGSGDFWRSTWTPHDGPATLHIRWSAGTIDAEAWGPGAWWMLQQAAAMTGANDGGWSPPDDSHPRVQLAARNHRAVRIGASGTLYHELLPVIIAQRITGGEAVRQWRRLCHALGERAPGPDPTLRLPPSPASLLAKPAWWYHPFGIEAKRANALRTVARHAARIAEWTDTVTAAERLTLLGGTGPWTIGSVLGPAFGDPDAVPVGDYHLPHTVAWALAREPRATDERMLELLTPFAGQRGRVVRWLMLDGNSAPAFGPRQRILPMHRW